MARDDDDDRPRKSWSEIDKARNKSAHHGRKDEGGGFRDERLHKGAAYRNYKTQLDKVFDGGGLPEAMKARLEESGVGQKSKEKKEGIELILAAKTPKKIREALASYREAFDFPVDEEVLAKLLDLEDEGILLETMATIAGLKEEGLLKRGNSLKARIKTVQMMVDDDDVQDIAAALIKKL